MTQLDEEFTKSRILAENELVPNNKNIAPWSAAVDQAYSILQFWILKEEQVKSGLTYDNDIREVRKKIREPFDSTATNRAEIKARIKDSIN